MLFEGKSQGCVGTGKVFICMSFEVKDFFCYRGETILLEKVSFSIAKGELFHLQGRNGIGKTTLLRSIVGLYSGCMGEVLWDDCPFSSEIHGVYLDHKNALFSNFTVAQQLDFWFQENWIEKEMDVFLHDFALMNTRNQLIGELSQGQKRKVGLLRIVGASQGMWILDEPFEGLDGQSCQQLEDYFLAHVSQGGCILYASHLISEKLGKHASYKCLTIDGFQGECVHADSLGDTGGH